MRAGPRRGEIDLGSPCLGICLLALVLAACGRAAEPGREPLMSAPCPVSDACSDAELSAAPVAGLDPGTAGGLVPPGLPRRAWSCMRAMRLAYNCCHARGGGGALSPPCWCESSYSATAAATERLSD